VRLECSNGLTGYGGYAILTAGTGQTCKKGIQVGSRLCTADRGDPKNATGNPTPCTENSVPSNFVSIGKGGRLAIRLDVNGGISEIVSKGGLRGCKLWVFTLGYGGYSECYQKYNEMHSDYLCYNESPSSCIPDPLNHKSTCGGGSGHPHP